MDVYARRIYFFIRATFEGGPRFALRGGFFFIKKCFQALTWDPALKRTFSKRTQTESTSRAEPATKDYRRHRSKGFFPPPGSQMLRRTYTKSESGESRHR